MEEKMNKLVIDCIEQRVEKKSLQFKW